MNARVLMRPMFWCCALLLASAPALAAEDIDELRDIAADGLVEVENVAGSIEFTTWDRDEVQIRGRVADDVEEVKIETTAAGLRIEVRNKRNQRQIDETRLYLKVPATASIEAEGGVGLAVRCDVTDEASVADALRADFSEVHPLPGRNLMPVIDGVELSSRYEYGWRGRWKTSRVSPRSRNLPRTKLTSLRSYWMSTRRRTASPRGYSTPRMTRSSLHSYCSGEPRP